MGALGASLVLVLVLGLAVRFLGWFLFCVCLDGCDGWVSVLTDNQCVWGPHLERAWGLVPCFLSTALARDVVTCFAPPFTLPC